MSIPEDDLSPKSVNPAMEAEAKAIKVKASLRRQLQRAEIVHFMGCALTASVTDKMTPSSKIASEAFAIAVAAQQKLDEVFPHE